MSTLKHLRQRLKSIKSTQKITSAMKMIAVAKLRRAQERVHATRPYSKAMGQMLGNVLANYKDLDHVPTLLTGNAELKTQLLLVMTSDRGLCGGFNSAIVREARRQIQQWKNDGIQVKILCIGHKGRDLLSRDYAQEILPISQKMEESEITFTRALYLSDQLQEMLEKGEFGNATVIYSTFKSALTQLVTSRSLIPFGSTEERQPTLYEYEPTQDHLLEILLEHNLAAQLYQIFLESSASEYGARMTAMDSATRNAREMIRGLELTYNKTRQGYITRELIEIISGAEALNAGV